MRFVPRWAGLVGAALLFGVRAAAVPLPAVTAIDTPGCDVLEVPAGADELGTAPAFPADEAITVIAYLNPGYRAPCAATPQRDVVVEITNQTSTAFGALWYVAEPETSFTNADGTVNGMLAFKIDAVGANKPLYGQSGTTFDDIFAPGDTWLFLIQDYSNSAFLPASALGEIGVPGDSLQALSSGSIIGIPTVVPEPAAAALVGLGLVVLSMRCRRGDRA